MQKEFFNRQCRKIEKLPFDAYEVFDFLKPGHYSALKADFKNLFDQDINTFQKRRFIKSEARPNKDSDSYSALICNPADYLPESMKVFVSKRFQDWISQVTNISFTEDVTFSLHHNPAHSPSGWIHTDYELVNFKKNSSQNELNLLSDGFNSQGPPIRADGFYSVVRSVALLFYFDDYWSKDDGGETFYFDQNNNLIRAKEPLGNSLSFFVIGPDSRHCFAGHNRNNRDAIVMWFHSKPEVSFQRYRLLPSRASFDEVQTFNVGIDDKKLSESLDFVLGHPRVSDCSPKNLWLGKISVKLALKLELPYEIGESILVLIFAKYTKDLSRFSTRSVVLAEKFISLEVDSLFNYDIEDQFFAIVKSKMQNTVSVSRADLIYLLVINVILFIAKRQLEGTEDKIKRLFLAKGSIVGLKLYRKLNFLLRADETIPKVQKRVFKHALITGSTSGLGKELLEILLQEGTHCTVLARKSKKNVEFLKRYKNAIKIIYIDLSNIDKLEDALSKVDLKKIDIFVHSAALAEDRMLGFLNVPPELWKKQFSVNLFASYYLMKSVLKKVSNKVVFVNVTSKAGFSSTRIEDLLVYRTSKAALQMLNYSFAGKFREHIFICYIPGQFMSYMGGDLSEKKAHFYAEQLLLIAKRCNYLHSGKAFDFNGRQFRF